MTLTVPGVDRIAGMLVYASEGTGCPGRIRSFREDFRVSEIFDTQQLESERGQGYVPVYALSKTGLDTPHAAKELAEVLKSNVNFAGMKDSNATTTQFMSARSSRALDPPSVEGRDFRATRVGYLPRPINRSMISGNAFRVFVRTTDEAGDGNRNLSESIDRVFCLCSEKRIPNFFGYQRFGLKSMVNAEVGKAIVSKNFGTALGLLVGSPRTGETYPASEARRAFLDGRYREAQRLFHSRKFDIERRVATYLEDRPGDYFGAFRRIPIVPRRLLVQSCQSYIFNLTLSRALMDGFDISKGMAGDNWAELSSDGLNTGRVHGAREAITEGHGILPLVQLAGYAFRDYGSRFDRVIVELMKEEGISNNQFYIKEAEEVSVEGGFRHAPLLATGLRADCSMEGAVLNFSLGKGEYATTLLREVLKPGDPLSAGF